MGKTSKGFGQPIQSSRKKSHNSPKPQPLSLPPLPDWEFLWEKEARILQVFETEMIPTVSVESLTHYRQRLQKALPPGLALVVEEALDWEVPYLYGPIGMQAHTIQRQQQPSYLDQYQLQSLCESISLDTGLSVIVQRTSDQLTFTLPLDRLRVSLPHTDKQQRTPALSAAQSLDDYHLWWEQYPHDHWQFETTP